MAEVPSWQPYTAELVELVLAYYRTHWAEFCGKHKTYMGDLRYCCRMVLAGFSDSEPSDREVQALLDAAWERQPGEVKHRKQLPFSSGTGGGARVKRSHDPES